MAAEPRVRATFQKAQYAAFYREAGSLDLRRSSSLLNWSVSFSARSCPSCFTLIYRFWRRKWYMFHSEKSTCPWQVSYTLAEHMQLHLLSQVKSYC